MLLVVAILVAILALGGGFAVHPLLFLLLILAVAALFMHGRSGRAVY
ncbi:MAG: hypothetical protein ABR564_08535 [Candidatus Dormibacteria bacterium]